MRFTWVSTLAPLELVSQSSTVPHYNSLLDVNFAEEATPVHETGQGYEFKDGEFWDATWRRTLFEVLSSIPEELRTRVESLAFDGTSGTALLVDVESGECLESPKWYNEVQSSEAQSYVTNIAPESHPVRAATSTLCKVIEWHLKKTFVEHQRKGKKIEIMHQADWLAYILHGLRSHSDYTNALKLGYDPEIEDYPDWLKEQDFFDLLPQTVVSPGTPIHRICPEAAEVYGLSKNCLICSGTTDSIAAFLASGANKSGQAVTSLGSTLAIKMLSKTRVDNVNYGVYSHRIGDNWLVGGASNTGGAVLREFFTNEELDRLSNKIDPVMSSGLDYYPLLTPGERFPFNDPNFPPRLSPRPKDDVLFLHGVLEGIAEIEGKCYELLKELGAGEVRVVYTAGGGAINETWTKIRSSRLKVPVSPSIYGEASYGAALLARGR
eukprot:g6364.t1